MGRRAARGFSLIELLIVVAIILVIAAIAIPNFLRARMAASEASAVFSVRTINTAEVTFSSTYGVGYSDTLAQLGPPPAPPATINNADLIDPNLATGTRSGYTFTYTADPAVAPFNTIPGYTLDAAPFTPGSTGERYFYTDESGVIRQHFGSNAGPNDPPVT